jgi:hypothetical protein
MVLGRKNTHPQSYRYCKDTEDLAEFFEVERKDKRAATHSLIENTDDILVKQSFLSSHYMSAGRALIAILSRGVNRFGNMKSCE